MNRNVLLRINTPEPARLWSGAGPLLIPADAVETTDAALYLGGGELLDGFDEIEQLINGTAARIDVTVSGVTLATARIAAEEAGDVQGAAIDVGLAFFDDLMQLTTVQWVQRYTADKLTTTRTPGQRVLTLSMGTEDTGRSRSTGAYWTAADQNRRSPTDRAFDRVSSYNAGTSRDFGPAS